MEQTTQSTVDTTTEVAAQTDTQVVDNTATVDTQTATETTEATSEETNTENTSTETKTELPKEVVQTTTQETTTTTAKKSLEELLAEHGYAEELEIIKKTKESAAKEVEAIEKPFNETKAWADLIEFGAKNKLATQEDFIAHKEINKQSNDTLAFNKFKAEYVPNEFENELEPTELEDAIKEAFNEKFFVNSENENLKKIGQQEIAALAEIERKPINDKILTVQNRMLSSAMAKQHKIATEEFSKNPQKTTTEFINEKGETVSVEVETAPTVKFEEVSEFLSSDEGQPILKVLFEAFRTNKEAGDKAFGEFLTAKYGGQISQQNNSQIAKSAYEKGLEVGKALAVGTKDSFNSKENIINGINANEEPVREYSGGKYAI